jgi:hypothetical protein
VAATVGAGTEVNFGLLARKLCDWLSQQENCAVAPGWKAIRLQRGTGEWHLTVKNVATGEERRHSSKFVFVGAGGGFLIIPALVILVGMPMKLAVGTSLFIIAAKSLIGFTGDLQQHPVIDWPLITTITGIAIVGLFVGLYFSKIVSEQALKKGFGYFVLVMGIFILFDSFILLL